MKHQLTDEQCCVAHIDGDDSCRRCCNCGKFIRPKHFENECPGVVPVVTIRFPKLIYASECCAAETEPIKELIVKPNAWETRYYHERCSHCGNPCWTVVVKCFDSAGAEVLPGDVVEDVTVPEYHAERWRAVYKKGLGLEMRDLGNNNVGFPDCEMYTRGPYWRHLDKLNDDDLEYYWNTTREQAWKLLKESEDK